MAIPDHYLQELRMRADIEQLIAPYVNLRRSGRLLMGLCPFHNEKTPSFAVYPDSNSFYCFGCGAGGDAVSFLMRMERLDYIEAVKQLSERLGMQLPEDNYDDSLAKSRMRVLSANREAARFFYAQLQQPEGRPGLAYWLEARQLTPQIIKRFGLGYAPQSWNALLDHMRGKGFSLEELVAANLVSRSEKNGKASHYDRFRGRVMVPILDLRGNVVAFGGRVLDDSKPKYINTSDTLAYKKGRDIYALNIAKNTANGRLILVEGYMDVIALHKHGFTQAVACLGTALTKEQAQLLARYAQEVALCYDADEAGQRATQRALEVLGRTNLKLRVLKLSGGKDPDDVLRSYGSEKFRQLLEGAANEIEFRLLAARGSLDLTSPAGKTDYLREAVKVLARCGSIERDIYASRLAQELEVDKQAILSQTEQAYKRGTRRQQREQQRELLRVQSEKAVKIDPERGQHVAAAAAEERILGLVLLYPDFYRKLRETLSVEEFVTPFNRLLAEMIFQRLENKQAVEPEFLSGVLTEAQLSETMRMRLLAKDAANPWQECEGCIQKLKSEQPKGNINVGALAPDEYRNLFDNLKQGRKG